VQPDRGWAKVEPGPELAYIKRRGSQPEEAVEVGQFWLSYSEIYLPVPRNVSFDPKIVSAVSRINVSPSIYFYVPGNNDKDSGKVRLFQLVLHNLSASTYSLACKQYRRRCLLPSPGFYGDVS
jgi:hypothetical protein